MTKQLLIGSQPDITVNDVNDGKSLSGIVISCKLNELFKKSSILKIDTFQLSIL